MGKKERTAPVGAERQFHPLEGAAVAKVRPLRPALVVHARRHGVARSASREQIGNEALAPAADRVVEREAVGGAPVPGEHRLPWLYEPVPFRLLPEVGDALAYA